MSKLKKAMEKAKEDRQFVGESPYLDEKIRAAGSRRDHEKVKSAREEINPDYSQTRSASVDRRFMKEQKIVSLFHEEEIADQLKILSTQVLNKMETLNGNSLLITSAGPGEGKTFTAINLAISLSYKIDHTVLLVDANLKKPYIHRYFGLEDIGRGLSDYLLQQEEEIPSLLINPGIEKLVILPGGRALPNSVELLGSPRMELLVKEMKERYPDRFIIFDSPSVLSCADALVFSRFIDGILLVVESEKTSEKDIKRSFELLKEKAIIGTVLNKVKEL